MVVHLQVAMAGAPPFRRQVKMKVPEGTTVEEALAIYAERYRAAGLFDTLTGISILVNGARVSSRQQLKENDKLKVSGP